jgi:hypothetical protein
MAQMVEDLQSQGVIPQAETVPPQAEKKALREPTSDYLSMMVDSIQSDKSLGSSSVHVAVNSNGSIALLDDTQFLPGLNQAAAKEQVHEPLGQETHGHQTHGHGHGHGFKEDGLLGGHIGTEIVEKLGHNAHHAVSHGTSEALNHGVAKIAGHGTAKAAGHGASEIAGHGASKVAAHGASEAAGHGAAKIAAHGSEAAQSAVELTQHGAETANATTASLKTVSDNAHHLSAGMEVALGVGTVAAGVLAVPLTINGIKELKSGIKEKNTEKIIEGAGGIAVGARSAGTAAVMAGMLTTSEVVGQIAGVAATTLTPLGIFHGLADVALGGMEIYDGKPVSGAIKATTGLAIGAAAVIGGLPLTVLALGMVGVKVGHKIYNNIVEKKSANLEAEQKPVPTPTTTTPTAAFAQPQIPKAEVKT